MLLILLGLGSFLTSLVSYYCWSKIFLIISNRASKLNSEKIENSQREKQPVVDGNLAVILLLKFLSVAALVYICFLVSSDKYDVLIILGVYFAGLFNAPMLFKNNIKNNL